MSLRQSGNDAQNYRWLMNGLSILIFQTQRNIFEFVSHKNLFWLRSIIFATNDNWILVTSAHFIITVSSFQLANIPLLSVLHQKIFASERFTSFGNATWFCIVQILKKWTQSPIAIFSTKIQIIKLCKLQRAYDLNVRIWSCYFWCKN